ncbi:hypothetical protein JW930_01220 [Candidatus Woesearchaeota archaeon]|nr:hypothetical protein [Candidatus Woesearchaeota archaeon]
MEKRGRPIGSSIRQNIVEILHFLKKGYGYEIYKIYIEIFPKITLRSVYYHLRKGADVGEFKVHKIEKEKGDYSWGEIAEKVYYSLGNAAVPQINPSVKKYFDKHGR